MVMVVMGGHNGHGNDGGDGGNGGGDGGGDTIPTTAKTRSSGFYRLSFSKQSFFAIGFCEE